MMQGIQQMMQMARMLKSNPQQIMLSQFKDNPMFARAQEMAAGKSEDELKQIASNLCKQRGINLDDAFKQFNQLFNGK